MSFQIGSVRVLTFLLYSSLLLAAPSPSEVSPRVDHDDSSRLSLRNDKTEKALNATLCESPIIKGVFDQANLPYNELGATVFALIYGYGLTEYSILLKGAAGLSVLGTNRLLNVGRLVVPGVSDIVRPNVDTIYAAAAIDLSQQDLNLTVPPYESGRYIGFSFFDPYGDNFATLGSKYSSAPGEYLVRPSVGTGRAGLVNDDSGAYESIVESRTYEGTLLIRVEVKQNSTAELTVANSFINAVQLNATNQHAADVPPLVPADLNTSSSFPEQTLQLTAGLGPRNPPQDQELAQELPAVLTYAGITDEGYIATGVNLTEAYALLNTTLIDYLLSPGARDLFANGWSAFSRSIIGSYNNGTALLGRALIAQQGYGANTPDQTIYPFYSNLTFTLPTTDSLLVTFGGGKPPLESDGFWSLTLYDSEGFLTPNPQGVYALGDRSNLTYPDGTRVYGEGSNASSADPYQILIQASDTESPGNWTSNWLPSPAGGGRFSITLRFYSEDESLQTGAYEYPLVQTIPAIVA